MNKKQIVGSAALCFALAFSAENAKAQNTLGTTAPPPVPSPGANKQIQKDPWAFLPSVIATIGNEKITKDEFIKEVQSSMRRMGGAQLPPQLMQQMAPKIAQGIVDKKILLILAKKAGINPGPELVIKAFEKWFAKLPSDKKTQFEDTLKKQGKTLENFKKEISSSKLQQENLATQNFLEQASKGKLNVTEEEAKKFYDSNPKYFKQPASVTASHILVKLKDNTPAADKEAKAKAEKILAEVKKSPEKFAEIAKNDSDCPSGKAGGSLGTFKKGQMVPAFEKAAFAMKKGEISNIVKTRFGYHIIKLADKKEASTVPFADAKDKIISHLKAMQMRAVKDKLLKDAKQSMKVKINI